MNVEIAVNKIIKSDIKSGFSGLGYCHNLKRFGEKNDKSLTISGRRKSGCSSSWKAYFLIGAFG